ncbi:MAG TPA: NAD-dependent deacylase [Ktedonobacteraceae bacterium]|jgi:NAD-dependent deacetylase
MADRIDKIVTMLQEIGAKVRAAQQVTVLTGAGISAESGLPTFRDAQTGLWSRFQVEDLATAAGFQRDPATVWNWYAHRRQSALQAQPNAAHLALVEIERRVPAFDLITQNIDGLHQRAGSQRVIEVHGSLARVKCIAHQHTLTSWPEAGADVPPVCPTCQSKLRPAVVWFGEQLPEETWNRALQASSACDIFLSIGTSGTVEPAGSLVRLAERQGAAIVVNNLEVEISATSQGYYLNGPAGTILPLIVQATWPTV